MSADAPAGDGQEGAPTPRWRHPAALLALALGGMLVAQVGWLSLNRRPVEYDAAWYLETAVSLERTLQQQGWSAFLQEARGAFKFKAPGVSMATALVMAVVGESPERATAVSLVAWLAAAAYLYLLARRFLSPGASALSAVLAASMPMAFSMARALLVEASLTVAVVAFLYHAAVSDRLRRPWHVLALAGWGAAGLMVKVTFPAYVVAPALFLTLTPWREARAPLARLVVTWASVAAVAVGVAAWFWYADNWRSTLEFARSAGYGALGAAYAVPVTTFLATAMAHAVAPWTVASFMLLAGMVAIRRPSGISWRSEMLASAWLVPPVLVLMSSTTRYTRYLTAVLPALALAMAAFAEPWLRRSARSAAVAVTLLAGPPCLYFVVATVPSPVAAAVRRWVEAPWLGGNVTWYEGPPDRRAWPDADIVKAAGRAAGSGPPAVLRLNVDLPELNHNNLKLEALLQQAPLIPAQIDQSSPEGAVATALDGDLLLLQVGGEVASDFLNVQRAVVDGELATGRHPYREVASFGLPGERRVTLLARRCVVESGPASGPPLATLERGLELVSLQAARAAGGLVSVRTRYRAGGATHPMLAVLVEVADADGRVLGGREHLLCRRPERSWPAGSVVEDTFLLPLGAVAPGLGLRIGLRDLLTGSPVRVEKVAAGLGSPGNAAVAFPRLAERLSADGH